MKIKSLLIGVGLAIAIYMILPFHFLSRGIEGSGNVVKEQREVSAFHGIDAGSAFRIYITKGDKQSVVIETDDNIQEQIKLKVKDGILEMETKGNIRNPKKMNAFITIPNLDALDLSGACKLTTTDRFDNDKMDIDLSGASGLEIKIKVNKLEIEQSGASKSTISGFAGNMELDASGASHSYMEDLEVNNANIDISGASHINYKGSVKRVDVSTSGAASVNRKG